MKQKPVVILAILLILGGILVCYAQYNNDTQWGNNPPSLYPQAGPGDLMIVNQLKETNRLLEQQNALIGEQNTLIKTVLAQSAAAAKKTKK
ncbi:MAG TPA: hypothetical protein VFG11_11465 [Acidobacteriota bacterium]|nr:hypothetical protein [Acidobacteriota bacterium]